MKPRPMPRNILISNEIDAGCAKAVINMIMDINYDDDIKEEEVRDWVREPIYVYINSNGGNAYDALAIYDVIQHSKTPVYTVALGWCMSAGLWIFMAGNTRLVGEHATLMFHDVTSWATGKTEQVKQELKEAQRLARMYCNAITDTSKVTQEMLDDYIMRKAEWYIPAEEAIKLKIANKYY